MGQPFWTTSLKTAPASEPLSLEEVKAHLREPGTDEDALIEGLRLAAREYVEAYTNRALFTQSWYLKLDAFPCDDAPIVLPKPPCQSVTAITYVDQNGTTQTWSSSLYQTALPSGPKAQYGRIQPAYQQSYPLTRSQPEAVTVEFIAGWSTVALIPESIRRAMLLMIGHWYTHRESVVVGTITESLPQAVDALLAPYALMRWA